MRTTAQAVDSMCVCPCTRWLCGQSWCQQKVPLCISKSVFIFKLCFTIAKTLGSFLLLGDAVKTDGWTKSSHKAFLPAYLTLYSPTLQIPSHFILVPGIGFLNHTDHLPILPPSCTLPDPHLHPPNQSISVQLFTDALSGLSWDNVTLL